MKSADPFKEKISEHLQEVAQNDKLFAETLKKPNKSIDRCIDYIYSEVKKTKRCGWNDDEIFKMAIHYYDEDSIKDVPTIQPPRVSHTAEKQQVSPKMEVYKKILTKEVQKPLKNKPSKKEAPRQFVQISLFD